MNTNNPNTKFEFIDLLFKNNLNEQMLINPVIKFCMVYDHNFINQNKDMSYYSNNYQKIIINDVIEIYFKQWGENISSKYYADAYYTDNIKQINNEVLMKDSINYLFFKIEDYLGTTIEEFSNGKLSHII
jgi:hypothetical protein